MDEVEVQLVKKGDSSVMHISISETSDSVAVYEENTSFPVENETTNSED